MLIVLDKVVIHCIKLRFLLFLGVQEVERRLQHNLAGGFLLDILSRRVGKPKLPNQNGQRESLQDKRDEDYAEGKEHDQVTLRKRCAIRAGSEAELWPQLAQ